MRTFGGALQMPCRCLADAMQMPCRWRSHYVGRSCTSNRGACQ
jgi:hypothetical protein